MNLIQSPIHLEQSDRSLFLSFPLSKCLIHHNAINAATSINMHLGGQGMKLKQPVGNDSMVIRGHHLRYGRPVAIPTSQGFAVSPRSRLDQPPNYHRPPIESLPTQAARLHLIQIVWRFLRRGLFVYLPGKPCSRITPCL